MHLGSFTIKLRLEAGPSIERIVAQIVAPQDDRLGRIEATMATVQEILQGLRDAVVVQDANRAEIKRLQDEKAAYVAEEAEEDRLEEIEETEHEATLARFQDQRRQDMARIEELERAIAAGDVITAEEREEMARLVASLTAPAPAPDDEAPPAPGVE